MTRSERGQARFAHKGRQDKRERNGQENDHKMRQTKRAKGRRGIHRRDRINEATDGQALSNYPEIARNHIGHPGDVRRETTR